MIKRILLLFTLTLSLVACEEEQLKKRDYSKPAGDTIALSLKATLSDGSSMLWNESSKIGIFSSAETVNVPCAISASSAGMEEGRFYSSLKWSEAGEEIYVYYPYDEVNTTTVLSGSLPQTYSQQSLSALNKAGMFYAKISGGAPSEGGFKEIQLSSVLSISSLRLSSLNYSGWDIERVSVKSSSGQKLSGRFTFDIATETFSMVSEGTDSIAVNLSGETLSEEGVEIYWLSKAGSSLSNANIQILISKEGEKNQILSGSTTLSAAASTDIDSFDAITAEDEAIDLSCPNEGTAETANCYIVSQPGVTYKFPATVMGNGASGSSPLAPKSAQVLWQTGQGLVENVKLKEGYISFTISGEPGTSVTPGNAVIAAYSEDGCQGRILWSWHLWITAEDLASKLQKWQAHSDAPAQYANSLLMDRNLGALGTTDWASSSTNISKGLNYQWGRKDPFAGPDDSGLKSNVMTPTYDAQGKAIAAMAIASSFSNAPAWTHVETKLSVADIAAYPMAFVSGASNYIWLDGNTDGLWSDNKTIYDPCPPGYKVMNQFAMSGITTTLAGGKVATVGSTNTPNIANFQNTAINTGEDLQVLLPGGSEIATIPASGLVYFEKAERFFPFDRVGLYGYLWSSTISAAGSTKAFRMHYDYATFQSREASYASYGHNVRCEKIQ